MKSELKKKAFKVLQCTGCGLADHFNYNGCHDKEKQEVLVLPVAEIPSIIGKIIDDELEVCSSKKGENWTGFRNGMIFVLNKLNQKLCLLEKEGAKN